MTVEIKKVMETDKKGVARQIYPETHVDAIIGLEKKVQEILQAIVQNNNDKKRDEK